MQALLHIELTSDHSDLFSATHALSIATARLSESAERSVKYHARPERRSRSTNANANAIPA